MSRSTKNSARKGLSNLRRPYSGEYDELANLMLNGLDLTCIVKVTNSKSLTKCMKSSFEEVTRQRAFKDFHLSREEILGILKQWENKVDLKNYKISYLELMIDTQKEWPLGWTERFVFEWMEAFGAELQRKATTEAFKEKDDLAMPLQGQKITKNFKGRREDLIVYLNDMQVQMDLYVLEYKLRQKEKTIQEAFKSKNILMTYLINMEDVDVDECVLEAKKE